MEEERRSEEGIIRDEDSKKKKMMDVVEKERERWSSFQMPLHYPNYTESDYESMPEWQIDSLLQQYGLPLAGDLHYKRNFAIGAFLWSRCRPN